MIKKKKKKKNNNDINELLLNVLIITLIAILFLIILSKFGGHFSDYITKTSCNAINEKYIKGKNPGDGICVKNNEFIDIKK